VGRHTFGGEWTNEKLERVRKYLCAYTRIFTKNPGAQHFTTIYVDAFAGTGHRAPSSTQASTSDFFGLAPDTDREEFKKGSARIALEVDPPFDRYVFVERSAERAAELRKLPASFPGRAGSIQIIEGEANAFLKEWCKRTNWRRHRAVVFLDPYGMQVEWSTLDAIARTRAIDLWLLFPLGIAVNRLLTREGPPPAEWGQALTRMFGAEEWRSAFYMTQEQQMLFERLAEERKRADTDAIGRFFLRRLKGVFAGVAENPLTLLNSTKTPIYLLCFAAGNKRGAPTAVGIAQDILKM